MLVEPDIFFEFINFMETATDHVFLGLKCIKCLRIDSEHLGQVHHLILVKSPLLVAFARYLLLFLHELGDALLAQGFIIAVDDRLREVDLAQVLRELRSFEILGLYEKVWSTVGGLSLLGFLARGFFLLVLVLGRHLRETSRELRHREA